MSHVAPGAKQGNVSRSTDLVRVPDVREGYSVAAQPETTTSTNDDGIFETVATIDNGKFGTRTIRFETGRLAKQAAGSVVAYLDDDTMLLSATTAGKSPREGFDFFPLTVDVEERMYAAGRIPGSTPSSPVA